MTDWVSVFVSTVQLCTRMAGYTSLPRVGYYSILLIRQQHHKCLLVHVQINLQAACHHTTSPRIIFWLHVFITQNIIHQAESEAECGGCGIKCDGICFQRDLDVQWCLGDRTAAYCSIKLPLRLFLGSSAKLHVHISSCSLMTSKCE